MDQARPSQCTCVYRLSGVGTVATVCAALRLWTLTLVLTLVLPCILNVDWLVYCGVSKTVPSTICL